MQHIDRIKAHLAPHINQVLEVLADDIRDGVDHRDGDVPGAAAKAAVVTRSSAARWLRTLIIPD